MRRDYTRILTIFILIIFSSGLLAQIENRLFWDGKDWNKIQKLANYDLKIEYRIKAAYLNGLQDGRLYSYLKTWPGNENLADSVFSEPMDYLTTSELVRVLNNFYLEPLNSYIPVPSAVIIANMTAEQADQKIIEVYTEKTRKWINTLMLQMQEGGNSAILEGKLEQYRERQKRPNQSE